MLGRATGINGGRAGSMNVNSPGDRLIGSFGIVGGSIAAATGAALALSRTTGGVAVAYFGDGAMNQGYVFECLNFAQVQKLPLVLVCENNGYGEYTAYRDVTAGEIRARAEVMEVPGRDDRRDERLDRARGCGARARACPVRRRARRSSRRSPTASSATRAATPAPTAPSGELDEWRARDPIVVLRAQLEADGATPAALDDLERDVTAELEQMRERGLAAPFPTALVASEFQD